MQTIDIEQQPRRGALAVVFTTALAILMILFFTAVVMSFSYDIPLWLSSQEVWEKIISVFSGLSPKIP